MVVSLPPFPGSLIEIGFLDIYLNNILVNFENEGVIERFVDAHLTDTMEYKIDSAGRPVYSRHNDFGLLNSFEDVKGMAPKIVDFGSAMRLEKGQRAVFPKQPDHYRPPEATLGCGWDHSSDIWMLGVLVSPYPFTLERRLELRSIRADMELHRTHGTF